MNNRRHRIFIIGKNTHPPKGQGREGQGDGKGEEEIKARQHLRGQRDNSRRRRLFTKIEEKRQYRREGSKGYTYRVEHIHAQSLADFIRCDFINSSKDHHQTPSTSKVANTLNGEGRAAKVGELQQTPPHPQKQRQQISKNERSFMRRRIFDGGLDCKLNKCSSQIEVKPRITFHYESPHSRSFDNGGGGRRRIFLGKAVLEGVGGRMQQKVVGKVQQRVQERMQQRMQQRMQERVERVQWVFEGMGRVQQIRQQVSRQGSKVSHESIIERLND